jgi:hypothetical protein
MEVFLYILAAIMTVFSIVLFGSIGYGLLIAWFAWCGGVLFDRLFLQPR